MAPPHQNGGPFSNHIGGSVFSIYPALINQNIHKERTAYIGYGLVKFDRPGIYEFTEGFDKLHMMKPDSLFRWDVPMLDVQLIIADENGIVVSMDWDKGMNDFIDCPDISLYLPIRLRYTAVVVEKNGIFAGWPM